MSFFYITATAFISLIAYLFLDLPIAAFAFFTPNYILYISLVITAIATPFSHLFLWGGLTFLGWTRKWDKQFTYRSLQLFIICGFILFVAGIMKILLARARPELFFHEHLYGFYFGFYVRLFELGEKIY